MNLSIGLGIMSGSSLDGLDLALVQFHHENDKYSYEILNTQFEPFPKSILEKLNNIRALSSLDLQIFDIEFGNFISDIVLKMISSNDLDKKPDFIVNHGHTVFHFPKLGFSKQIGNNQVLASKTEIITLGDLRQKDIQYHGSGAPIVPIFDLFCLSSYMYCLNLGGIMNISINQDNEIIAFDIGVCNQLLNYYAQKLGYEFDSNGELAKKGTMNSSLFDELNALSYFHQPNPKSLDNGFKDQMINLISNYSLDTLDVLCTLCHHIAFQVSKTIQYPEKEIYSTGGGVFNTFLIDLMINKYHLKIYKPSNELINYKEAIAMAFFGYRYFEDKYNTIHTVTGAQKNVKSGIVYNP